MKNQELINEAAERRERESVVIRLEDVSVRYRVPHEQIRTFKEYAIRALQRRVTYDEFYALSNVSLEVYGGEVFGVIGRNGAGKSTLLRVVAQILRPTKGRIWRQGRVAPLLELGAGFHTELTGRENVYLNGALLGFTRAEMAKLFDGIVSFAELENFIDTPLRNFSSGMTARLGFAVATAAKPDILIVDEVLSVGDEQFQLKCKERINSFRRDGATILFVSHNASLVQDLCDRVVWLERGRVRGIGPAREIVPQYQKPKEKAVSG